MVYIGVQKFENRKYKMTPLDMVYVGVQKFKTKSKMTPLDMVQVGVLFKNEKWTRKKKWMKNKRTKLTLKNTGSVSLHSWFGTRIVNINEGNVRWCILIVSGGDFTPLWSVFLN